RQTGRTSPSYRAASRAPLLTFTDTMAVTVGNGSSLSRIRPMRSFSQQMSPKPNLRVAGPLPDLVAGGPVEFDELFARYGRYVARLAARLLGSGDAELDDVVQDVFWLASRRLRNIADMIQARGWLA